MQKSTFSVNFFIRRTRLGKSGETPIMMRISVDGRYTELSTQRRVPVEQWSQSRCCATGKTAVALEINRHLDNLRSKASEAHQNFLAEDGYVDPFIIKEFLLGKHRRQRFFFEVFEEHNARIASLVGKDYDRTTYHRYMLCLRYFREMMAKQTKAEDFPIRNLSHEMVRNFEHFLKTKKRVAQNTMIRYMKCLKKVVNLSLANGWMTVNPFAGIKYAEKKVIREYLTMPEVNRLREKEFSIQRLEMVRDIFLFCCYTGLAYIDVHNLRPENITEDAHGRKWIRKQREKTDVEFYVPLLEYPLQILEKYKNHPLCKERGTLLPVYANQKMNSYLKEIADFCGIKKQLTMHIARHSISSFALKTNGLQNFNLRQVTIWKRAKFPYLSYSALLKRTLNFDCKSSENFQVSNSQRLQGKMVLGEDSYGHSGDKYFWPLSYSSAKTAQKRMDKLELAGIRCKLTGYNSGCIEFLGYTPETEALLEQERQEVIVAHQAWQAKQVLTA